MNQLGLLLLLISALTAACTGTKMKANAYFENVNAAALADAAAAGDEAAIGRAMAKGADPNAKGTAGITPLLYVLAETRNKNGIRGLLRRGADPNYISPNGISPMLAVAQGKDPELLSIFLEGGGNPNLQNQIGRAHV